MTETEFKALEVGDRVRLKADPARLYDVVGRVGNEPYGSPWFVPVDLRRKRQPRRIEAALFLPEEIEVAQIKSSIRSAK